MKADIISPETCHRLSALFYTRAARDPVLRPLFPGSLRCATEAFGAWLVQFTGGPPEYAERRWWLSLREAHERFRIGEKERVAWLQNMELAMEDAGIEDPWRGELARVFEEASAYIVHGSYYKSHAGTGAGAGLWAEQRVIEDLVAAVRNGKVGEAFTLAESPVAEKFFARDRAGLLSLLAMMSGSGNAVLVDFVRRKLRTDAQLAQDRYYHGRTLLHGVAEAGCLEIVELLLELGASPDGGGSAENKFGHTPLYSCANGCGAASGAEIVHTLARAGANVNARGGVKRCTPLHMAARRGNVAVGLALIEQGADLQARDTSGDTPLRRALNCRKPAMAAMLVARGAKE